MPKVIPKLPPNGPKYPQVTLICQKRSQSYHLMVQSIPKSPSYAKSDPKAIPKRPESDPKVLLKPAEREERRAPRGVIMSARNARHRQHCAEGERRLLQEEGHRIGRIHCNMLSVYHICPNRHLKHLNRHMQRLNRQSEMAYEAKKAAEPGNLQRQRQYKGSLIRNRWRHKQPNRQSEAA